MIRSPHRCAEKHWILGAEGSLVVSCSLDLGATKPVWIRPAPSTQHLQERFYPGTELALITGRIICG